MKLKINNKYADVGFWSFMKCQFLTSLVLAGIVYAAIIILAIIAGIALVVLSI